MKLRYCTTCRYGNVSFFQVYIVAVDREIESYRDPQKDGETEDEYGHRGESLLSLVKPELENLSRHWFNALRDHALLSLPSGKW